ncbi:transcription intermediary factor [Holotrichia oblita]|uniref:Transcription intermediary factor n=1 Tax=Holotrichia oblita TaxID=644536 RepID=A0ACB9T9U6_HOLOL|nr:transcription intermediary factor [Holotrichia oblita]
MAEGQISLNDQTFIPLVDIQHDIQENTATDIKLMNTQENVSLSNEVSIIEDMVSNTETVQETKANETVEKSTGSSTNTAEDRTTESPSTGENYIYKCVFCDQVLSATDDPKLLECLHNACGSCTNNKLYEQNDNQNKGVECPTCGLTCEADKIIDNQFLLELNTTEETTTKVAELKCSSCSDDNVATSWCVDCSEYICDICVQAHQRLKITKDHTIKPKEDGAQENQTTSSSTSSTTLFCTTHPHEKLSLFCEYCDKLTCRDCQLIEHREHKYKFTHEIAHDARKFIAAMLKDISYKRVLLSSAVKVIADRQSLITEKKKALVLEITQLVVKLTNTINVREKIALDQLSKMTDHCIQFTQHALDNGSDMALLYSKKQVTSHLQRIKCKRADIPNPEIPVRIHLALDKVPELIKVISTIGQIVVDGRVYPSQPSSPSASMTPQSSPSPVHQQTPMNVLHQQLQQTPQHLQQPPAHIQQQQQQQQQLSQPPTPTSHIPSHPQQQSQQQQQSILPGYQPQQQQQQHHPQQQMTQSMGQASHQQPPMQQQTHNPQGIPSHRMLPPYGQQYNQSLGLSMNQNTQQSLGQKAPPNMGNMPPNQPANIPISLPQHLQLGQRMPMQRSPMRPMLPICHKPGLNNQQQVLLSVDFVVLVDQDRSNLRGLLQANGNAVYVQTAPGQYQAVQPQYAQQFQNRFQSPPQYRQQMRLGFHPSQQHSNSQHPIGTVRIPIQRQGFQSPPLQQNQPNQQPSLKWHIPQQTDGTSTPITRPPSNQSQPFINDNFKITLKSQNHNDPKNFSSVSSTIPKTPSPNHIQGKSDTENNLDKYCEDSVNDLMATIAKLDSNGVQVLAENRPKTGGSPHVDSSTGDLSGPSLKLKSEVMEMGKDDPNEDWCAVCMDGGELVCCDKCPKVFHQSCHIPNLRIEENDTWQCLLCMNFADIPENALGEKKEGQLSLKEKKIAERLVLELYCQYEPSLPFRELISPDNVEYHTIIKKAMALDSIRQKLDWNSPDCYTNLEQLVRDVRLMFQNAYRYNAMDNPIYSDAKTLEKFFDEQLEKWLPEYAYETFDDEDLHPPSKKYRRIISD